MAFKLTDNNPKSDWMMKCTKCKRDMDLSKEIFCLGEKFGAEEEFRGRCRDWVYCQDCYIAETSIRARIRGIH